jgi:hypothetical protein
LKLDPNTPLDSLLGAPVVVSQKNPPVAVVAAAAAPVAVPAVPVPVTPGHVFVVRSDIRYLLSDAWVIPINGWQSVNRHWVPKNDDGDYGECPLEIPGFQYVRRVQQWPKPTKSSQPVPYGCRMPRFQKMESVNAVMDEFVAAAKADLEASKTPPRNRRSKYLFSLPLLMTGLGGMRGNAGQVVKTVLPHMEQLAATSGVDLVLVVVEEAIYSMLQTYRRRSSSPESFALLSPEDKVKAEELAGLS